MRRKPTKWSWMAPVIKQPSTPIGLSLRISSFILKISPSVLNGGGGEDTSDLQKCNFSQDEKQGTNLKCFLNILKIERRTRHEHSFLFKRFLRSRLLSRSAWDDILGWVTISKSSCFCIIIAHHDVKSSFRTDWLTQRAPFGLTDWLIHWGRCNVGARKLPHFKNWTFSQKIQIYLGGQTDTKLLGKWENGLGKWLILLGKWTILLGKWSKLLGKWSKIVGEMKQNCWGNDTSCWGSEAICVGEMPQIQSAALPVHNPIRSNDCRGF